MATPQNLVFARGVPIRINTVRTDSIVVETFTIISN